LDARPRRYERDGASYTVLDRPRESRASSEGGGGRNTKNATNGEMALDRWRAAPTNPATVTVKRFHA
jgi:hypothetical protein